jgi:hypothetical protein
MPGHRRLSRSAVCSYIHTYIHTYTTAPSQLARLACYLRIEPVRLRQRLRQLTCPKQAWQQRARTIRTHSTTRHAERVVCSRRRRYATAARRHRNTHGQVACTRRDTPLETDSDLDIWCSPGAIWRAGKRRPSVGKWVCGDVFKRRSDVDAHDPVHGCFHSGICHSPPQARGRHTHRHKHIKYQRFRICTREHGRLAWPPSEIAIAIAIFQQPQQSKVSIFAVHGRSDCSRRHRPHTRTPKCGTQSTPNTHDQPSKPHIA